MLILLEILPKVQCQTVLTPSQYLYLGTRKVSSFDSSYRSSVNDNNSINGHQNLKSISKQFLQMKTELGHSHILNFLTRGKNILDPILTNRPDLINKCTAIPRINDHQANFEETEMCTQRRKLANQPLHKWQGGH